MAGLRATLPPSQPERGDAAEQALPGLDVPSGQVLPPLDAIANGVGVQVKCTASGTEGEAVVDQAADGDGSVAVQAGRTSVWLQ